MVLSALNGPWEHLGALRDASSSPLSSTWQDSESSALVATLSKLICLWGGKSSQNLQILQASCWALQTAAQIKCSAFRKFHNAVFDFYILNKELHLSHSPSFDSTVRLKSVIKCLLMLRSQNPCSRFSSEGNTVHSGYWACC